MVEMVAGGALPRQKIATSVTAVWQTANMNVKTTITQPVHTGSSAYATMAISPLQKTQSDVFVSVSFLFPFYDSF